MIGIIAILVAVLVVVAVVKIVVIIYRPRIKGWFGEKGVSAAFAMYLDKEVYQCFNDIVIESNGVTTQIDHVVLSRHGVFVVETKHMKGWIFGDEKERKWMQMFRGGRKYPFQNPLRQNHRHIKMLQEYLALGFSKFHSLVVFLGEIEFKTSMPRNVLNTGWVSYIEEKTEILLTENELSQARENLIAAKENSDGNLQKKHVQNLRSLHSDSNTEKCPRCGNRLILHTAKRGPNAGGKFYGCSAYPKCKYIKKINVDSCDAA